jgi:hypothetical protein
MEQETLFAKLLLKYLENRGGNTPCYSGRQRRQREALLPKQQALAKVSRAGEKIAIIREPEKIWPLAPVYPSARIQG